MELSWRSQVLLEIPKKVEIRLVLVFLRTSSYMNIFFKMDLVFVLLLVTEKV